MTTQLMTVVLQGSEKSRIFEATLTDAANFAELVAKTGGLSLDDVMRDQTVSKALGEYAAGLGFARIRNTDTEIVKGYIFCDPIGEGIPRVLHKNITIEENDIIEGYSDVA